jgi:hypothetical protein
MICDVEPSRFFTVCAGDRTSVRSTTVPRKITGDPKYTEQTGLGPVHEHARARTAPNNNNAIITAILIAPRPLHFPNSTTLDRSGRLNVPSPTQCVVPIQEGPSTKVTFWATSSAIPIVCLISLYSESDRVSEDHSKDHCGAQE